MATPSLLRQSEKGVISDLHAWGMLSEVQRSSVTTQELTIPPRVVADLAVRHLHPEEGAAGQPTTPPFRYWRVPHGRAIILHAFFGLTVLMDFKVVAWPVFDLPAMIRGLIYRRVFG